MGRNQQTGPEGAPLPPLEGGSSDGGAASLTVRSALLESSSESLLHFLARLGRFGLTAGAPPLLRGWHQPPGG